MPVPSGMGGVHNHCVLNTCLVDQIQPHKEEGQEEEERADGVHAREGEQECIPVAIEVVEILLESLAYRCNDEIEVPSYDRDYE